MKRRDFFIQSLATAGAAALLKPSGVSGQIASKAKNSSPMIEKVKTAMLAMQRAAWEQGVASQAFLELRETDMVILMAKEAVVRQLKDGRLAMLYVENAVADPAANGRAVIYAAKVTGDSLFSEAADRMLNYLLTKAPKTADGILHHITDKPQIWSDAAFMAPPFLAAADRPDEAVKQLEGFKKYLWNPKKKLYSHIWDEGKNDFTRKDCWGGGNGWVAAGTTQVIRALPPNMTDAKKRLADHVRELIDGCLAHQREDGLFHDVVDDPSSFVETNLAQMLAYSIFHGIQGGWLNASYRMQADKMRKAAHGKVDQVGLVQDVCGSPTFEQPGTSTEGQAFFLLMEAAAMDM